MNGQSVGTPSVVSLTQFTNHLENISPTDNESLNLLEESGDTLLGDSQRRQKSDLGSSSLCLGASSSTITHRKLNASLSSCEPGKR